MKEVSIRDKDLTVQDILSRWPETLPVFIEFKLLCVGCAVAPFHTIEDACFEHDIAEEPVREALDEALRPSALRTTK